ncbi:MAG TPA: DUF1800 family protein [Candidatus Sulfotelmatobacter sp.]|nr:DUF1800 family protein [Candidatus Sulfotelmatobacter sp.]
MFTTSPLRGQMIDQNGNGMSDVWEWLYNATNAAPNADPDGDGVSNLNEARAGTSPFNSNSVPKISAYAYNVTNGTITMPAQFGKVYQLQSLTNVTGSNWLSETSTVVRPAILPIAAPGAGTNFTFQSPVGPVTKFYRLLILDTNSDGTGLMNDWEKYQLGLDPTNPFSNATMDNNGVPLSDYQFATNNLASQNMVTISASDPVATQPDPGAKPQNLGQFTVTRGGFALDSITVGLGVIGSGTGFATSGVDYSNLPASVTLAAGVSSAIVNLTPMANLNLQTPAIAQVSLLPGMNYVLGNPANASVVVYPSPTAKGYGLLGQYYTNSSVTYTNAANFNPANLITNRIDPTVDFVWTNGTSPNLSNGFYSVRWTGQIQPQYSELYIFDVNSDDGCRLSVNDQLLINKWQSQGATDWTNSIMLQAGTLYDIKLEYLQAGGAGQVHLKWYSADQSEQVIPNTSLYPTNSFGAGNSNAPTEITSALNAYGYVGQPFTFTVTAANTPLWFTASNLPPGLSFTNTNGVIAGTPTLAGNYQILLTATNAIGTGASVVDIQIFATNYSSVVQEIWTGVPGTNVADIPTGTPATITNTLPTLEGITNYGDNYGERVRGYFIAPVTGNYYFWIAGSDSAQLWISDDNQQVNKVLRAWVTPTNNPTAPGQKGTSSRQWNLQASQQSGWLSLSAGQPYYIEILHKAGTGTNDNWSVAWLQDPTGTNNAPAAVTPNYLLTRYYPPLSSASSGTLYSANLLALPGVNSQGVGSATLLVNAAGTQATLNLSFTNLAGTPTGQSINSDPYLTDPGELIFDISAAKPQANGSYLWNIKATGPLQVADIQQIIAEGSAAVVIESTAFPNGEISGHLTLANGSQSFTPPPPPPAWTDDHTDPNAAARFLTQATFGPTTNDIASVQALGYAGWISNQLSLPPTFTLPVVLANASADPTDPYPSSDWFNAWWQNSITAPDQLRQRVAFALSETMVISENGVLENNATALSSYYDTLVTNAFGNYRSLLESVTLTPGMGLYLNMQGNGPGSIITGLHANENYAREVNQLFSIGLNRLWPDGSLVLNSQNSLVPTYGQGTVMGFASVFTGWNYYQTNQASGRLPTSFGPAANYTNHMVLVPKDHELGTKLLLDNVVLPPAWGTQTVGSTSTNDNYCSNDLEQAMNAIYNHPNVGPFICRQLIQRLVTSNPSRDYVYRVTQVFNNDGTGVRGNLQAVVQAILLDYEARSTNELADPTYGKQREPVLRITASARAFPAPPGITGTYTQNGSQTITITTTVPHMMNSGDTVLLGFTDTSGNPAPPNQGYSVSVPATNQFTVNAPNLLTGSYVESNNVITITISGNGVEAGNAVYLGFTTGGAASGGYLVTATNSSSVFTVNAFDGFTRSGNCLMPRISASGFVQKGTNVTVSCSGPHGLVAGQTVFVAPNTDVLPSMQYQVVSIPDPLHFVIYSTNSVNQTQSSFILYPLDPPPLNRSGNVTINQNTWNLGYTDTSATYSLSQSPLRSPTVFNFYYPTYEFPGVLASAGLTTPEFQLTSDTTVALAMNFIESGLLNNTGNTNGLSSYVAGNGSIVMNLAPWMTPNLTTNTGIPTLVSNLNSLLVAGQLSGAAQTNIINYVGNVTNFPYSNPPTQAQMRDRVRAAVHLILCSPDCTIQK